MMLLALLKLKRNYIQILKIIYKLYINNKLYTNNKIPLKKK